MLSKTPKAKSSEKQAERAQENALLARCKDGDTGAFDELVRRYEKRVYSFAYRLAGNQDDANDVAQEAFIRVFNSIRTFRGDAVFTTWMAGFTTSISASSVSETSLPCRSFPSASVGFPVTVAVFVVTPLSPSTCAQV